MKIIYKTDTLALKKLMIENGISTIIQLSSLTRISRNTLSQVLNGQIQPSATVMHKLVEVLKITPEQAGLIFFNPNLRVA
ncbi:helix-turn-helix domain-containing protein [Paenibacillus odorifer]|uniref:helix-turn-helix domain-containing protein n=1 Tax=Paenibacillus odorifer TaxID=189426 RepID=UPI00289B7F5D|nr:helix-turn-helix transcriptional regulator [Paenibacillus odorifer]